MTIQQRAQFVEDYLDKLYPAPAIPLLHKDPYTLLVAVILSAQCTDVRVNQTTPQLFELADNPKKMSSRTQAEIEQIIRSCGLAKNKSKHIREMSQILVDEHKGEVPKTLKELESLPGVGHKTASVMMIQAFNTPAFPVDTHIHRLAKQWGLSSGKNVKETEKDLMVLFPKKHWSKIHLQIIYYGREYSPARGFRLDKSPIDQFLKRNQEQQN